MTRRLALAVALAFTTVVTFALVAIGAQAGLFGDGGKDGAPAEASVGETATPQTPGGEPTVVTEYIYIDQTVTPAPSGAPSQDSSGSAAGNTSQVSGSEDGDSEEIEEHDSAGSSPSSDDDHEDDDDHESEHEEDDD